MANPKLILIADDYDHVARFLARMIEVTTAFNAISAVDGIQALQLAIDRKPDVVLLDIDMPGLDGINTAGVLRERLGTFAPLLIGMTEMPDRDDALLSVFDVVLMKPIQLEALLPLLVDL